MDRWTFRALASVCSVIDLKQTATPTSIRNVAPREQRGSLVWFGKDGKDVRDVNLLWMVFNASFIMCLLTSVWELLVANPKVCENRL